MSDTKKRSKSYYLTPVKFIRDLVHKYVNLTEFELEIIDHTTLSTVKRYPAVNMSACFSDSQSYTL